MDRWTGMLIDVEICHHNLSQVHAYLQDKYFIDVHYTDIYKLCLKNVSSKGAF